MGSVSFLSGRNLDAPWRDGPNDTLAFNRAYDPHLVTRQTPGQKRLLSWDLAVAGIKFAGFSRKNK